MAVFTAWGHGDRASTLIAGEGPPRFADGTRFPDCEALVWRIEADSWEDACRRYHELQGWEPYRPMPDG
jgi:hypothetical protein